MADTKISALTDVVTLAGGDLFAIDDVSATASKSATATEINTFVRGVAPTIPTAGGTALQHVKSDGTNLILTTETQAAPGSTGNTLISDGTNWLARNQPVSTFNSPAQAIGTTDTYITNSGINVPASGLHRVGMRFDWLIDLTKTAAGTAQPIWNVRFGTGGTISDTARATFTEVAQTAVADDQIVQFTAIITTTGATGKLYIFFVRNHRVSGSTGFNGGQGNVDLTAAFDLTVGSSIIGLSVTTGTSAAWTTNNILTTITY